MTTHSSYGQGEQDETADVVRSLALSSAKLWEELFRRLNRVEQAQAELHEIVAQLQSALPSELRGALGPAGAHGSPTLPPAPTHGAPYALDTGGNGTGDEEQWAAPFAAPFGSTPEEAIPAAVGWSAPAPAAATDAPPPPPPSGWLSSPPAGDQPAAEPAISFSPAHAEPEGPAFRPPPPPPSVPSAPPFGAAEAPPPPPPGFAPAPSAVPPSFSSAPLGAPPPPPGFSAVPVPEPPGPGFHLPSEPAPPPPAGFTFAGQSAAPPPPPGFAAAPPTETAGVPSPPPGFASAPWNPSVPADVDRAPDHAGPGATFDPAPMPPGFTFSGPSTAQTQAAEIFGAGGAGAAPQPPPPPPGFFAAGTRMGEHVGAVGHAEPENGHTGTERQEAEEETAPPITPDFFARAGRRRH